jgi:ABC-type multidrug transport system fused ATPase/permease subunit
MKNIFAAMKGRTVIVFTQRVQMMTRVDRVFFLEQGELIEQGSHRDLIANRNRYFDFYLQHLSVR